MLEHFIYMAENADHPKHFHLSRHKYINDIQLVTFKMLVMDFDC